MDDKRATLLARARTGPLRERARALWDEGRREPRRIPRAWSGSHPSLRSHHTLV